MLSLLYWPKMNQLGWNKVSYQKIFNSDKFESNDKKEFSINKNIQDFFLSDIRLFFISIHFYLF